ncbi:sigma-70 family RNA polymerase sigma factor [Flavivirga sp. 57AJ16]|uniref:sigma-70 family RNA polymerase sigma factor n=1 Tax=Flavivirga sp. 57AJ16 TaxID=3025307 RepID=UPI0023658F87|nr:sigma-70 family RNA polymerase sigma factor [Flavivirga sp. 57AJ16]MDD7887995.1 sigma-70 family RNA polymerase sigma factor [Flavivirga sp. 57AJ16]
MKDYQNKLFPYAYNILGSSDDAKDAIQDVLVRYHAAQNLQIENVIGYLIKSVINQSINLKKRKQKITHEKIWLPEPLATEKADDTINSKEIISYSMLVLLEKLTPKERAVFILKQAFEYSHKDIAEVIDSTIENSRKLLSRANTKLAISNNSITQKNSHTPNAYMKQYIDVIKNGDVKRLEKMLSKDILLMADGGGKISVVRELTIGKSATLKLLFYVFQTYQELQTIKITEINHQPALLFFQDNKLVNCQVFEFEENQIRQIFSILVPNKLKSII